LNENFLQNKTSIILTTLNVAALDHSFYIYSNFKLLDLFLLSNLELNTLGSRFTTGLRSRIFGCKSNRRRNEYYLNGLN